MAAAAAQGPGQQRQLLSQRSTDSHRGSQLLSQRSTDSRASMELPPSVSQQLPALMEQQDEQQQQAELGSGMASSSLGTGPDNSSSLQTAETWLVLELCDKGCLQVGLLCWSCLLLVHDGLRYLLCTCACPAWKQHLGRGTGGNLRHDSAAAGAICSNPPPPCILRSPLPLHHILQDCIDRGWLRSGPNGPVSLAKVVVTATEIAAGMYTLHRADVLHGDLSPYNVLLTG